jgi:predicted lysophospholipase L1 biosynthesis ABC-type transport system permease subunit
LQLASLLLRDAVVLQVLGSGARTIRTAFWIDNTRNVAT